MKITSQTIKSQSIKSMESTIRKLEKALTQMREKGANTTLLEKRLKAFRIGLAMLEYVWNQEPCPYNREDLAEARHVIVELIPSIRNIFAKSKAGSPQRTLLERRIKALELALQAIDDYINGQYI